MICTYLTALVFVHSACVVAVRSVGWKKVSVEGSSPGVLLSLLSMWLLGMSAEMLLGA
jgi:hypothetical protein